MDYRKTGRLISSKRKSMGLTQGGLSEQIGVTPQAIHLWETGQNYPDPSSQVMIHKVLGLNPVELMSGLEMYDEDLKHAVDSYMNRIDEQIFVAGNGKDEDGNDVYIDFSDYLVITTDKDGNLTDRWIPYTDYYNVEEPSEKKEEEPKTPYDATKIYLNHGHCILTIPIEMLEKMGKPLYFKIGRDRGRRELAIVFVDEMSEEAFDIPEKLYSGRWKGVHVHGGEFGHVLCVEMGVRHTLDLLEATPEIDVKNRVIVIRLDEAKRSNADVDLQSFLLPKWQYEEMWEDEEENEDEDK